MTTADRAIRSNEPPGTCENITVAELRELVCKGRDSWWTVLLVDPVALRLVRWTDRHTEVTPDQVTWAALALGLGAAAAGPSLPQPASSSTAASPPTAGTTVRSFISSTPPSS
ncbi:hypothetical protein GCM10009665_80590 [Kitasatospora nipponensis]|uniref:Uncharacterized protein n=1 Tax=Kitasatospora nipponensis TaxID=258049 RepID=A0ABP4E1A9_9ACTN